MTFVAERTRRTLLLAAAPLLSACSVVTDPQDTFILEVAEARATCMGMIPQECFIVRHGSGGELQLLYEGIIGFDYTPGYRYRLAVVRTRHRNPPQDASMYTYRLERELWRERSERADLLAETAAAEAKWLATAPPAYEMVQQRVCFCGSAGLGSVRVAVTRQDFGGTAVVERVTSLQRVADGSTLPEELRAGFLSVQGLFNFIRWSVADDAHRIDVEFDEESGHPRRISTDRRAHVSDDEIEYVVESVTPIG